jgi:predicted AAA+ superfamily ATPase
VLIPRQAASILEKLAGGYPLVAITGPRQSGKTTLAREVFGDKPYVSLEDLDERAFAESDPRGFLARLPDGAVLDEVQRCPALFSYLQTRVDEDRRRGLFVLTGSQQFGLLSNISQTLAGRVAVVTLLPFSLGELQHVKRAPATLEALLFQGLYPPIYDRGLDAAIWYKNYVASYVERDVRQMVNVRDLSTFQRFVRMCAARTGQLLNLSGLAIDCGITHNTAASWLSVLEASFILHRLEPYHVNFGKRLVKTLKLYFYDSGLAAWLLGIQSAEQLAVHPQRGPLFETWVVAELLKARFDRALGSNLYFWRDRSGREVDLLIEQGAKLVPVEVKSGQTVAHDFFQGIDDWRRISGQTDSEAWLVFGGDREQERGRLHVLPWRQIGKLAAKVASTSAGK